MLTINAEITLSVISLHKRFADYETFGGVFRDIREGLLELTFIERLLPIIAELLEKIACLFGSTLDDLLESTMADEETRHVLECILRYNQNFLNGTIGSLSFAIIGTCNHSTDDTFKVSLEDEDHIVDFSYVVPQGISHPVTQHTVSLHVTVVVQTEEITKGSITNCMGNRVFLNGAGLTAHGEGRPSLIANDFSLFKPKCIK